MSSLVMCLFEVFERRVLRAQLLGDAHGGEIEEEHQQALVVILDFARPFAVMVVLGAFGSLS